MSRTYPIIPVDQFSFVFVNFYLGKKSKLVTGVNITGASDEDACCGVVKKITFMIYLFLGKINYL